MKNDARYPALLLEYLEQCSKNIFLNKHKKIRYIGKCIKHLNDDAFVNDIIYENRNPHLLRFESRGKENYGKSILIIPNICPLNGFCAELRNTLKLLVYADQLGFIPYVLYDNNYLYYEESRKGDYSNPFEYYFQQPAAISYESAMNSCNVFWAEEKYCNLVDIECREKPYVAYAINDASLYRLGDAVGKYIRLNKETEMYVNEGMRRLFDTEERVLAVHHRGTDYKAGYIGHPKYVSIEEKIEYIKEIADAYDKIFVATDDSDALKKMVQLFGNKVCYYDDVYRCEGDISVAFRDDDRTNHKYRLGREILRDVYTLAACDSLLARLSQVSYCAQLFKIGKNEQYKEIKIINKGVNEKGRVFGG